MYGQLFNDSIFSCSTQVLVLEVYYSFGAFKGLCPTRTFCIIGLQTPITSLNILSHSPRPLGRPWNAITCKCPEACMPSSSGVISHSKWLIWEAFKQHFTCPKLNYKMAKLWWFCYSIWIFWIWISNDMWCPGQADCICSGISFWFQFKKMGTYEVAHCSSGVYLRERVSHVSFSLSGKFWLVFNAVDTHLLSNCVCTNCVGLIRTIVWN